MTSAIFSENTTATSPADATASVPAAATDVAVTAEPVIQLTEARLKALLVQALQQGQAAAGIAPVGAAPVDAEPVEHWTVNELMHHLVDRCLSFTERQQRAAYAAVDVHFPAEGD